MSNKGKSEKKPQKLINPFGPPEDKEEQEDEETPTRGKDKEGIRSDEDAAQEPS